jgi:hypothetical protein
MPRINGQCVPPVCVKWIYQDIRVEVTVEDPNGEHAGHEHPAKAAIEAQLKARLKNGVQDCDGDCNCHFIPGADVTADGPSLPGGSEDFTIDKKTYTAIYSDIRYKVRVFFGVCYPVGAKLHWASTVVGGD